MLVVTALKCAVYVKYAIHFCDVGDVRTEQTIVVQVAAEYAGTYERSCIYSL